MIRKNPMQKNHSENLRIFEKIILIQNLKKKCRNMNNKSI